MIEFYAGDVASLGHQSDAVGPAAAAADALPPAGPAVVETPLVAMPRARGAFDAMEPNDPYKARMVRRGGAQARGAGRGVGL